VSSVSIRDLSINLATVRQQYTMGQAVDACLAQGITAIAPWRDQVQLTGLAEAAEIVRSNKLRVTGLCRGGMFPAADKAGLAAAIDDNKRAIDEAVALQADCLVLVVGGLPGNSHEQIMRAGAGGRILAHHICDWLVPTRDLLLDRGMMGDGVIDLRSIRSLIENAGYHGPQEVEIFSAQNWWKRAGEEVLATCVDRFLSTCT
jgi:sugar phosphate isomerase/epimerase